MKNWHSDWSCCELLSDFVYSFFEHNCHRRKQRGQLLWIAFRFCIFVLWTQLISLHHNNSVGCELLSDFVYSFFEHNSSANCKVTFLVVNCFQILYIRSLNTICQGVFHEPRSCELLSDFVYSFFEHNCHRRKQRGQLLWIAFRFCIFVLWTQLVSRQSVAKHSCELLSDFVYSFFEHNHLQR